MAWQKAAALSELSEGGVIGVHVGATPLALYQLDGVVYATHGICTHAMAILADGFVEDGKIECPLHQALFDIKSGKALSGPATEDLRTFAVKIDGDDVLVDLDVAAASDTAAPAAPSAGAPASDTARSHSASNGGAASEMKDLAMSAPLSITKHYAWPAEGLSRIPDWVYTDQTIYEREVDKIFHGPTWNFVALECELPKSGDFVRSNVGPTPVVVSRASGASIHVFENRC